MKITRRQVQLLGLRRFVPSMPGSILELDDPFQTTIAIFGPPGRDGSGANSYEHIQSTADFQWTVNHNLGRRPSSVRVLTPGGVEMEAQVTETSLNQIVVTFLASVAGTVVVI